MSSSEHGWFPPGFRSVIDLVDEIGREIHGVAYWPDNPPNEIAFPRATTSTPKPNPQLQATAADTPVKDDPARGRIEAAAGSRTALEFHESWYFGSLWEHQCEQHRTAARNQLRTKLAAGEIEAFVLCSVHGDVPIDTKWWRGEQAIKALRSGKAKLLLKVAPFGKAFITVSASGPVGVRSLAQHQNATARAEVECRKWLAEQVRSRRYRSKKEYLQAAQASIPRLSEAAFLRAWRAHADNPGNDWMTKSGRRKSKSRIE